ncbi:MAG: hypothetical protein AB1758_22385 [Candidatus Eremiobacterota bacterium]
MAGQDARPADVLRRPGTVLPHGVEDLSPAELARPYLAAGWPAAGLSRAASGGAEPAMGLWLPTRHRWLRLLGAGLVTINVCWIVAPWITQVTATGPSPV